MYSPKAKYLREHQTPWEAKLWKCLRAKRVFPYKFKRQVPIGRYIVDFCCQERKLVIELDGGGHANWNSRAADAERSTLLVAKGYKVLRFWNNEIDDNMEGVLITIQQELDRPLSSSLQLLERETIKKFKT